MAATRILIAVSAKSRYRDDAWAAPQTLLDIALDTIISEPTLDMTLRPPVSSIKLMAVERWDLRTYIVFDNGNETYDPQTAHLAGQNNLPVVAVFFGTQEKAFAAGAPMQNKVNADLRKVHDSTGVGSEPPFFIDHANGAVPVYWRPRTSVIREKQAD